MKNVHRNIISLVVFTVATLVMFTPNSQALDWTYVYDSYNDASGGDVYEVYRMGYAFDEEYLYFNMLTGFPQTGDGQGIEAGDLYINIGGSHNTGTGTVFGLGLTNHEGDMNNDVDYLSWVNTAHADDGYDWDAVQAGYLYQDAVFSTGVNEGYAGANEYAEDGGRDPFGSQNNIPTHIAEYEADLGFQGNVTWEDRGTIAINETGTKFKHAYEVNAVISLEDLGVLGGESFELWWSMECGNELAMISGAVPEIPTSAVPEPGTILLFGGGLLGLCGLIRKRRS
jgi:hypothetical protein